MRSGISTVSDYTVSRCRRKRIYRFASLNNTGLYSVVIDAEKIDRARCGLRLGRIEGSIGSYGVLLGISMAKYQD